MIGNTAEDFRKLFRRLTTGVSLVAVAGENGPTGMTVNSLTPVSLDPPLLLFCASLTSATAKRISAVGSFSVNILGEHQQDVSMHHAGRPFATPTWCWRESNGVPWVEGANAIFRERRWRKRCSDRRSLVDRLARSSVRVIGKDRKTILDEQHSLFA